MNALNKTTLVALAIALLIGTASWAGEASKAAPPAKTKKAPSDPLACTGRCRPGPAPTQFGPRPASPTKSSG